MDFCFFNLGFPYTKHRLLAGVTFSFIPGKVWNYKQPLFLILPITKFILLFCLFQILDECYRVIREVMTKKQTLLNSTELLSELRDMTQTASNHFKEHVIPANKGNRPMLTMNPPTIFTSTCFPMASGPVIKMEDRFLIENHQRKEISELKSKVIA